jgi:hypothetical protein
VSATSRCKAMTRALTASAFSERGDASDAKMMANLSG